MNSLWPHKQALKVGIYYYFQFTEEELSPEKLSDLPKITKGTWLPEMTPPPPPQVPEALLPEVGHWAHSPEWEAKAQSAKCQLQTMTLARGPQGNHMVGIPPPYSEELPWGWDGGCQGEKRRALGWQPVRTHPTQDPQTPALTSP